MTSLNSIPTMLCGQTLMLSDCLTRCLHSPFYTPQWIPEVSSVLQDFQVSPLCWCILRICPSTFRKCIRVGFGALIQNKFIGKVAVLKTFLALSLSHHFHLIVLQLTRAPFLGGGGGNPIVCLQGFRPRRYRGINPRTPCAHLYCPCLISNISPLSSIGKNI